ncbi:MAG: menaquinol oxidoreductase [Deltaproteobacteria bacterium GWB2_55_19]|nr:MAG: menaquinol oxidoreductase [Deltaproteobacteria bacterium GWB2_55_19]HAO92781.1 menaquinol oxidoreductase [Deltaproteobacteria bacterium]
MKKLILYAVVGGIAFVIGYFVNDQFFSDRAPVQPINFSHKIHAGDNQIPCQYCHIYAERSRVSGVPNVKRCMGCHQIIKTDSPEIQKVASYWDKKEPIPWVKVYNLPDHVYFPHKRHVRAGVDCKNCHGDVASMARIEKVSSLQMGWCLSCHTKREVKNGHDCWTCHK